MPLLVPEQRPTETRSLSFKEVQTLDPSAVSSIDFVIASGDSPFEPWVDDLTLLCQGPGPNR
jgi:hypothetical protein